MKIKYFYISFFVSFLLLIIVITCSWNNPYSLTRLVETEESVPIVTPREIIIESSSDFDYSIYINDMTNKPTPPASWTQSMRAIALSPDKSLIYTAFILGSPTEQRYLHAYNVSDGTVAYSNTYSTQPRYCKAVAVHSSGRVYYAFADSDEIGIFNPDLSDPTYDYVDILAGFGTVGVRDFDPQGVAVYGNYLYVSSDQLGRVYRYNLNSSGAITSHDSTWNNSTGYVQISSVSGELVQLCVNPNDGSIWCAAEDDNQVYRIAPDGTSFSAPLTIPSNGAGLNAAPHDVDFISNYILVAYAANDGRAGAPRGIGVFRMDNYQEVTTLIDSGPNPELRNAQGLEVDETKAIIYVVDGYFGTPNDLSNAPNSPDIASERDLILKLEYNK